MKIFKDLFYQSLFYFPRNYCYHLMNPSTIHDYTYVHLRVCEQNSHLNRLPYFFIISTCFQYIIIEFLVWSWYMSITCLNSFFISFLSALFPSFLHFLISFLLEKDPPYFLLSIFYITLFSYYKFFVLGKPCDTLALCLFYYTHVLFQ